MADSLFDDRYRYDYIYPRGRSGETLRAVDTRDNNRPVVIKRPAPNDAPPIRAGQEVSILNERKALTRVAGHPAAAALLGSGQFSIGGSVHQYIVMERAQGAVVADTVLELAAHGERIPELEMLVFIDSLLDLLLTAHAQDIVYNDVDAKHLFWDRDRYRLKVIDWGNAVFLEGDEITPQGVSRQSDIFQVGELLYFILTGGSRLEIPRDAGEDFRVDFGRDADRVPSRLQSIVSRAVHPNTRLRYRRLADLRQALVDYRAPIERDRDAILARVTDRLKRNRSKDELHAMIDTLTPALMADPGHPASRRAESEIHSRLQDLEVSADLDAARIYLESGSWARAYDLLDELRERASTHMLGLIELLGDIARAMIDSKINPAPPSVLDAIVLLFDGHPSTAANRLLTTPAADDRIRAAQWLVAERISAHNADILLLRPNLFRLEGALTKLAADGIGVGEPRALMAEINTALEAMPGSQAVGMAELRDGYRTVVDQITALGTLLESVNARHLLDDSRLPMTALDRALNAAMALADNMHVIGRQATASPRDAIGALDASRQIDPMNASWDIIARLLDALYELLGSYQTYVPAADGSDLDAWLVGSQADLQPFTQRLFDEVLTGMVSGMDKAAGAWTSYAAATIQGNRIGAITALAQANDAVATVSPTLAGWFNQLRTIITNANYIERHALYGGLGRALADGWEAFDRGRLSDAERLGQQAYEIARTDPERYAAGRLRSLSEIARAWAERSGMTNIKATTSVLAAVEKLYTVDEESTRTQFAGQMPSKETYLKAMGKGLIEIFARHSTAAVRILYFNYILLGVLDAHEGSLEDAEFWRDAAEKTLGEYGARHAITRALDEFIQRRRDIHAAAIILRQVNGPHALATLETTRRKLEENPQSRMLAAGIHALRELEASLRDWSDGEFRAAGTKLENAINAISEVEQAASITLTDTRTWLMDLQAGAAELHTAARTMNSLIERRPTEPVGTLRETHRQQVALTTRLLGESYAATLRQWRDTYEAFLDVYTSPRRRSDKLNRFNELFRAMFIDRHPAYPLYRHWYDATETAPEFPAPPTDEPTPRIKEDDEIPIEAYTGSRYAGDADEVTRLPARFNVRSLILLAVGGAALLVIGLVISALLTQGSPPQIALTITDTPTQDETGQALALLAQTETAVFTPPADATQPPRTVELITPTLVASDVRPSPLPVLTSVTVAIQPGATDTPAPTSTPTITPTPTPTLTPSATLTPTLPPEGLSGEQNLLALAADPIAPVWNSDLFVQLQDNGVTYWRLGTGEQTADDEVQITMPADTLETAFGGTAAGRIRRVEATLNLATYFPPLLDAGDVYFGLALQDVTSPEQLAGIQLNVVQPNVVNLGQRVGSEFETASQRSINALIVRLRIDRDPSGNITTYFNDEPIGQTLELTGSGLIPVLYAHSGVIINVTEWLVTLEQ